MPGNVEDLPVALPPGKVAIKTADGVAGTIDQSQVDAALDDGATLVSSQEIQEAKKRAEYSTPGMEALSAAGGVGSTLTLGLSDQVGQAIGGETYQNAAKYNPTARFLGQAAGFLAPWGAESLAEHTGIEGLEALGGAPALISKLGVGAEGAVAGGLEALAPEAARGVATDMLANALSKGAGVGLEGALYGAGQAVSDNALDPEQQSLQADKVLASMEKGALYAGGLGAAAGALGSAGQHLAQYLGGEGSLGEMAEKKAGEIAWRSAGGTKAMARGAEHYANGPEEVGKIWINEAPELAGEESFRNMTREKLAEAAEAGQAKYGAILNDELGKVDAIAAEQGALPKVADLKAGIDSKITDLRDQIGTGAVQQKLQQVSDDLGRIGGLTDASGEIVNPDARITFTQLRNMRRDIDSMWAGNSVDPSLFGFKKDFHEIRKMLEDKLETGAQSIAESAGGDFADAYKDAKTKFQAFKLLEKAADSGTAAQASNNLLSLNTRMAANAGAVAGAFIGHGPGALVGGAIGAVGGHFIRERGDFWAADLLSKLGQLKDIAGASSDMTTRVLGAASSFVHSPELVRATPQPTMGREEYQQVAGALRSAVQNPAAMQQRLTAFTAPLAHSAPNLAQAVSTKAAAGITFLASKLPETHGDGNLLQVGKGARQPMPSPIELESFQRYLKAFEEPESVLDDMRAGRITREGIETVRANYPSLFQQMRQELMQSAADPKAPELSYEKLVQLGVMFDMPTTEFLQPETFAAMQASYGTAAANAGPEQQPPIAGPTPNTTKRPLKIETDNMMSPAQESASR